jgi:CheY-like chemotaxis protein
MNDASMILLVEDDFMIRSLHQRVLEYYANGVPVQTATDGLEALAALRQRGNQPTLVLLDLNMPNMDGLEFLEAYLALPFEQRSQTQIIVLSGTLIPQERQRVQALGIRFVPKPLQATLAQELVGSLHLGAGMRGPIAV